MKFAVQSITAATETSAFSMREYVNNDVVLATSDDIGKLKNEISTLQYRARRMTSTDTRSKPNSKPWKPEVTPPRRRGSNFRGKGGRQNDAGRQTSNSSGTNGNSGNGRNFNGRNQSSNSSSNNSPLAIGVRTMVTLVEIKETEVEVEVGLTPAQMSEDLD